MEVDLISGGGPRAGRRVPACGGSSGTCDAAGGGAGPGAESGSRASGLVGTLRGRRHIPGNGGARPGAGGAGRRAGAGAAAGRGSVEVAAAAAEGGGWREARASEGGAEILELWEGAG